MTFNVLSLFDGLSAGNLALERAGYKSGVDYNYYASEVDNRWLALSGIFCSWKTNSF